MLLLNPILEKLIIAVIGIAFFLIALIAARRARPTFNREGELVMRYSPLLQMIANFIGMAFPLIAGIVFLVMPPKGNEWIPVLIFLPSAFILVAYIFLEIKFHRIIVNGEGIRCLVPLQRTKAYQWRDISEVSSPSRLFPFGFHAFVFHGKDGGHFPIPALMTGMSLLIDVFKAQLDSETYQKAQKGIEWSNFLIRDRWGPRKS